jgi:hypothetical protein
MSDNPEVTPAWHEGLTPRERDLVERNFTPPESLEQAREFLNALRPAFKPNDRHWREVLAGGLPTSSEKVGEFMRAQVERDRELEGQPC